MTVARCTLIVRCTASTPAYGVSKSQDDASRLIVVTPVRNAAGVANVSTRQPNCAGAARAASSHRRPRDARPRPRTVHTVPFLAVTKGIHTMIPHKQRRGTPAATTFRARGAVPEALARRVYAEFREMPGLRITVGQGQRLFGLDAAECAMVLDCLAEFGILTRLPGGSYARPSD